MDHRDRAVLDQQPNSLALGKDRAGKRRRDSRRGQGQLGHSHRSVKIVAFRRVGRQYLGCQRPWAEMLSALARRSVASAAPRARSSMNPEALNPTPSSGC